MPLREENRKLLKEIVTEIRRDMSDEEVLNLLADSKISENTEKKEKKDGGVEFVEVPASEITFSAKKAPAADEKADEEAQKSE